MKLPLDLTASPADIGQLDELTHFAQTVSLEESGREHFSREHLESTFTAPGFELQRDTVAVRDQAGELVGLEWVTAAAPFVAFHAMGLVAGHRLGEGIGTALLDWARSRARARLDKAPDRARVTLSTGVDSRHRPSRELMEGSGMELVRYFVEMRIDFAGPTMLSPFPQGLTVRTFRSGEDDAITYRAIDEAFGDHYGHVERPFEAGLERFRHRMALPSFDPGLWWLVFEDEEVVGACLCHPSAEDDETAGYVASLSVRKPWRGRGIAKALLLNAFGELRSRGRQAVTLHVDADSLTGATRLYEAVGMRETARYAIFEAELRPGRELSVRS